MPRLWICFWFWICLNNSWIYLVMPNYAGIHMNMPNSAWIAFVLHLPIAIFYLKEAQVVFLKSKNLIFHSSWRYLILFFVSDWIFLQDIKFAVTCGDQGFPTVKFDVPSNYLWCFLTISLSILLLLLFHFGASKNLIRDSQRL